MNSYSFVKVIPTATLVFLSSYSDCYVSVLYKLFRSSRSCFPFHEHMLVFRSSYDRHVSVSFKLLIVLRTSYSGRHISASCKLFRSSR